MANSNVRVVIPSNAIDLLQLAAAIYAKHLADGDASPLNMMQANKWTDNGPKIAEGITYHNQAEELKGQASLKIGQRDLLVPDVNESVKASRDVLLGVFRNNPRELISWGFTVNDTPKAAKKPNSTTSK